MTVVSAEESLLRTPIRRILRAICIACLATLLVWGVVFGLLKSGWISYPADELAKTALVFLFFQICGAIFSHIPPGNEFALFRLGMVAFCRTLLPLAVFALLAYNERLKIDREWVLICLAMYFLPLISGIADSRSQHSPGAVESGPPKS